MNKINKNELKPLIKWVGGKRQLLTVLKEYYPENLGKGIDKYVEPFVGGGAVLCNILSNYDVNSFIFDINPDLISLYQTVRDDLDNLIEKLDQLQEYYNSPSDISFKRNFYYDQRSKYNRITDKLEKSVLLVFLNKTCFNGLYRVNKKGQFNTPFGYYERVILYNIDNLVNVSDKLKKVSIIQGDFIDSESFIDENTFVYLDPPYVPLTETSNFSTYTLQGFNIEDHKRLMIYCDRLNEKGAKFLLSNSKSLRDYDFFIKRCKKYNVIEVEARRAVNSKGNLRGKVTELLIKNY